MIKLAIVGTGGMANAHATAFKNIQDVEIVAVCDVIEERVLNFAKEYNIDKTFISFDEMLDKCELDAISNVTPDSFHKEIALKSLNKNKHIFSEKPLAENYPDAEEMYKASANTNCINMVNLSYRNSSGWQNLSKVLHNNELGKVRHVDASYYQSWLTCKYWGDWKEEQKWLWRLSEKHGSKGVLGDLGVHIFDFASYPVGNIKKINCRLKTFKDKGEKIDEYVLDANDSFISMVEFDNGAIGTINSTRFATGNVNRLELKIYCDKGAVAMKFDDPITQGNYYSICTDINATSPNDEKSLDWEIVKTDPTPSNYERFITSIISGKNDQPDFKRGADIQKILDSCFLSSEKNEWIDLS